MRWLAAGIAWVALVFIAWKIALILGAMLLLTSLLIEPQAADFVVYQVKRGVVRTVRAAIAKVRRRRAATPPVVFGRVTEVLDEDTVKVEL